MCKPSFNLFEVAGGGGNSNFLKKFLITILVLIFSRKLGKKNVNFFPR